MTPWSGPVLALLRKRIPHVRSACDIQRSRLALSYPLNSAHTTLAQTCFAVLLQLDEHVDRDSIESFPLAKYAAYYWVKHVKFENVLPRIEDGIKCLFDKDKPHYAAWL